MVLRKMFSFLIITYFPTSILIVCKKLHIIFWYKMDFPFFDNKRIIMCPTKLVFKMLAFFFFFFTLLYKSSWYIVVISVNDLWKLCSLPLLVEWNNFRKVVILYMNDIITFSSFCKFFNDWIRQLLVFNNPYLLRSVFLLEKTILCTSGFLFIQWITTILSFYFQQLVQKQNIYIYIYIYIYI